MNTESYFDDPPEDEPADSVQECAEALARRQAATSILQIITRNATAKQAGQRALVLAHALRLSGVKTQKEIASKLHLTPGRVSQLLNTLRRTLTA